jgi:hypothetical protein
MACLVFAQAKVKLESATEEYDRVRTGDRRPGKGFGLRGSRSGAQYEEDAHRRVGVADTDYSHKVQLAQTQRHELIVSFLPQAVQSLKELIKECDAGLSVQIQKYGIDYACDSPGIIFDKHCSPVE